MTGQQLLKLRNHLGLTQREFAERIGYNPKTGWQSVSEWENEKRSIPPLVIKVIRFSFKKHLKALQQSSE